MSDIPGALAQFRFLDGMCQRHLALLAGGAQVQNFAEGEYLGREGEPADRFFLVQSGYVSLGIHTPDRGVVVLQSVGPGNGLGWSWLVPPHRWRFDCRASGKVETLAFDAPWLREQCDKDHDLGYDLLQRLVEMLASRLGATRLQLVDLHR